MPSNFDVSAPDDLNWMVDFVSWPKAIGIEMLVPGECFGDYQRRLVATGVWPFGMMVLITIASIGREAARFATSRGMRHLAEANCLEWQVLIAEGIRQAIPITLVITFILLPSTAYRIFRSLLCDSFSEDDDNGARRRYLRDDLSLECDTDAYDANYRTAMVLIGVCSHPSTAV